MICGRLKACIDENIGNENDRTCSDSKEKCIESSDRRSAVKCEEKGKKYILDNSMKNHVISYKMDGGVVSEEGLDNIKGVCRCDYLFVDQMDGLTAVLIELKGSDVNKAIEQISATLSLFSDVFRTMTHIYGRIVVSSSTPNLKASPGYVKLARMLKQRYHGNLKIKERQLQEKDVELHIG